MFQRIMLALATLFLLVACGEPAPAEPSPPTALATRIAPQPAENTFLAIALEEVQLVATNGESGGPPSALRVFMIIADTAGNRGGVVCPSGGAVPANTGSVVRPCSFALGIQEAALGESLFVLLIGIEETPGSPLAALGYDTSVGLLAAALSAAVDAAGAAEEVALEAVLAQGAPELQQAMAQAMADERVAGAAGVWLQKAGDWSVAQPLLLETQNGSLRAALSVTRARSASRQRIVQLPVQAREAPVTLPTSTIAVVVEEPTEMAPEATSTRAASATWTPIPTPVPAATATPAPVVCPGALPTRLTVGGSARVINYQVNVRTGPGTNFAVANRLRPGRVVEVLQPPQCDDGQLWYHVLSEELRDTDGRPFQIQGWVVEESDGTYYLEPLP